MLLSDMLVIITFMFINMVLGDTQIAYDIDNIECASSNHINNMEACTHWRNGMKYRNMQHIFCKPIILQDTDTTGFQCTPAIVDYDGTMIYVKFTQSEQSRQSDAHVNPAIKVFVDYRGVSNTVQMFWSSVCICIMSLACACAYVNDNEYRSFSYRHPSRSLNRERDNYLLTGLIMGNGISSRRYRRSNITGGWGVIR